MKILMALMTTGAMFAMSACDQGTAGGPGTATPDSEKPTMGQTDNTFTLSAPMMATKLAQGDTLTFSVEIDRGEDFNQDVNLMFDDVPTGLSIAPNKPVIRSSDGKADVTITASDTATVGEYTLRISGRPDNTGSDATTEMKIEISERDVQNVSADESEQWQQERAEYIEEMREELAAMDAQYLELQERAADAQGPAKVALERQLAEAESSLDAASENLDEMENASPGRWETMKSGFSDAMRDLKSMFS